MNKRTIGSILLAFTLLFAIGATAFASETGAVDPTIIISAPTEPPQVVGTDPTPVDPTPVEQPTQPTEDPNGQTSGTEAPAQPTVVSTPTYDIYPYGDNTYDGNHTANGNMYYKTASHSGSTGTLAMIESTTTQPATFSYTTRYGNTNGGDYLYLVCADKNAWDGMTVTFTDSDNNVVQADVPAEYLNELTYEPVNHVGGVSTSNMDAAGHWFRVAIPQGATAFTATKDASHTASGSIFELRDKPTRYADNWTLGDMQYRLPDSGTQPTLIYPIFTEEDVQTLEAGGETIYAQDTLNRVDETQIAEYAKSETATLPTSTAQNVTPVLYETNTDTVTYEWEGNSKIYFQGGTTVNPAIYFDLNFAYIGAMGIIYGKGQSLLAMMFSSAILLGVLLKAGANAVALMYMPEHLLHFVAVVQRLLTRKPLSGKIW